MSVRPSPGAVIQVLSIALAAVTELAAGELRSLHLPAADALPPDGRAARALHNDNREAAGRLADDVLTLRLDARETDWYPEDTTGPGIPVFAFAEAGQPASVPGPILSIGGPHDDARPLVNGSTAPPPIQLRAGVARRFRFINISPLETHRLQLTAGGDVQQWRALAKDGAELPPHQATSQLAELVLHPGETYDFEVVRPHPGTLTLTISSVETIANRAAARARGVLPADMSRILTEIPVVVR